ncbi:MAG TPA: hypothetical protein VHO01_07170, partial [Jatrophihabitans sp.]|nr:hypothetical protein [Jatrophihabitans sp.]
MTAARLTSRLSRIGFDQAERAGELLTGMGLWDAAANQPAGDAAAAVVSALARTADPDQALRMLAELADTGAGPAILTDLQTNPDLRARLLGVLG